jgi:hypothetical protein
VAGCFGCQNSLDARYFNKVILTKLLGVCLLPQEPIIEDFILQVQNKIQIESAFAKTIEYQKKNNCTWDVAAKRKIGAVIEVVFHQNFLANADEKTKRHYQIFIEGGKNLPEWWKRPYFLFGSRLYPDVGALIPKLEKRVAIELDHSQAGRNAIPGSKFKMALAKAAFSYLSHDWDYSYVFFYNQSGKPMGHYLEDETEKGILERYAEEFHTRILLFEERQE